MCSPEPDRFEVMPVFLILHEDVENQRADM